MEPLAGFEPATYSLQVSCSTTELQRHSAAIEYAKAHLKKKPFYETIVVRSFDDRSVSFGAERNVRAPMERLVGNAHPRVIYQAKAREDQYHRDEPARACETPPARTEDPARDLVNSRWCKEDLGLRNPSRFPESVDPSA